MTGGSYGGIESWLQASQASWAFPHVGGPTLPVLDLQVAVPKYPSTDLAYCAGAERPRRRPGARRPVRVVAGRRRTSDSGDGNPIGAPKASYIDRPVRARRRRRASSRRALSTDRPVPVHVRRLRGPGQLRGVEGRATDVGDPTLDEDPIIQQIRRGLTEFRGAYYQDEGWEQQVDSRKVAVFSIQGWTDDLFEAVESFRMFKYLKRLDPKLAGRGLARRRRPLARAEQAGDLAPAEQPGVPVARSRTSTAATSSRRPSRARRRCAATARRSTLVGTHARRAWRTARSTLRYPPGRSPRAAAWPIRTGPPPTRSSARSSSRASRAGTPTARPTGGVHGRTRQPLPEH